MDTFDKDCSKPKVSALKFDIIAYITVNNK